MSANYMRSTLGVRPRHRWKAQDDAMGAFAPSERCEFCGTTRITERLNGYSYFVGAGAGRRWQGKGAPPCELAFCRFCCNRFHNGPCEVKP